MASFFLPQHLREPISLIYSFARQADDFADEGDLSIENRLALLNNFRDELDLLHAYIKPQTIFFAALGQMIRVNKLPFEPFYDLLDAFSQDVTKTRYANYNDVLDYCTRSANPIGRLLLHLYGKSTPSNIQLSDNICTALQFINFLQDIAIDFKNGLKGIHQLPVGSRFGVYVAYQYYFSLFKKIQKMPVKKITQQRVRIPDLSKLMIIFKSYFRYKLQMIS